MTREDWFSIFPETRNPVCFCVIEGNFFSWADNPEAWESLTSCSIKDLFSNISACANECKDLKRIQDIIHNLKPLEWFQVLTQQRYKNQSRSIRWLGIKGGSKTYLCAEDVTTQFRRHIQSVIKAEEFLING